jgi:hypothetical protein
MDLKYLVYRSLIRRYRFVILRVWNKTSETLFQVIVFLAGRR